MKNWLLESDWVPVLMVAIPLLIAGAVVAAALS